MMGFVYSVISWIMLSWHWVWERALPGAEFLGTNWDWILSIVFLVLTVRAILFPVFVKQIKSQRAMQALQPQLKALQEQHKGDRETLNREMMELYRRENANPLMGCLPMVLQIPVFLGLFHVLRHLKPGVHSVAFKTLYGWSVKAYDSASHANLFGAPISATFKSDATYLAPLGASVTTVRLVAGILTLIMMATTYLTSRQMIMKTGWSQDPQQLMMQRLMLYGAPAMLLFTGIVYGFPIGVIIYWVVTNLFSLGQQFWVLRKYPPPATAGATSGAARTTSGTTKSTTGGWRAAIAGGRTAATGGAKSSSTGKPAGTGGAAGSKASTTPGAKSTPQTGGKAATGKSAGGGTAASNGKASPGGKVSPGGKGAKQTNGAAVPMEKNLAPRPGAKPVNPKKGNVKRPSG
jgi:YidC/Oxa1 family membrane protein insertase